MPRQRSDEAERWYSMVYMAVQEVPYGKVTTYGHIARLIGERKLATPIRHSSWSCATESTSKLCILWLWHFGQ